MVLIGILFALFYAVIFTVFFSLIFRNTGPWGGFWIFFILIFFVALAAGEWAAPVGPTAWGYYWIPGLFAAVIFALLLAAAAPATRSGRSRSYRSTGSVPDNDKEVEDELTATSYYSAKANPKGEGIDEDNGTEAIVAIGVFFWILIIILVILAISGLVF